MVVEAAATSVVTPGLAGSQSRRRFAETALQQTLLLAVLLTVASAVLLLRYWDQLGTPPEPTRLHWWVLALAFGAAELVTFHVELRREAHTFTLAEVPLVLAFFFARPADVLIGRLVAELVVLGLGERQLARKLLLNLAAFLGECAVGLTVFHMLPGEHRLAEPVSWVVALVAIVAADAVSIAAVTLAIKWHGGPTDTRRLLLTNIVTVITNTSLALAAALLITTEPAAVVLLSAMCGLIVMAYRGYTSLSQRHQSLELLYDFTRLVNGVQRPDAVLGSMLAKSRELLRAEIAGIFLLGEEGELAGELWGDDDGDRAESRVPAELVWQLAAENGARIVRAGETTMSGAKGLADWLEVRDCLVARLGSGSDTIGVLVVAERQGKVATFSSQDARMFESLANHASVALENGRLIDRLHVQANEREHESLHDALTGLPNRAKFRRELETTIAEIDTEQRFGVALMDLDHFKEINDTLGHHCGDLLLIEVARRLEAAAPPGVLVARLGGDEFALLTQSALDGDQLLALGRHLLDALKPSFVFEGATLEIEASIGFAVYPDHASDAVALLQRADVAMYAAKSSFSTSVELYDSTADTNSPRRLMINNDLRQAIEQGQLVLHYQPRARLVDGEIVGAEALVRWQHPELGLIYPDEFVPVAERTGLVQPFTDYVISAAIAELAVWTAAGCTAGMSINLSMRNLLDLHLPARVAELVALHDLDPSRITLEVTESTIMAEPAKVVRILEELAAFGIRLSVDDFGTGYSSLAYLQRLPVHEVKIDKSFVMPLLDDPGAGAIVRSVIDLARNLGLLVVAEGVESSAHWEVLAGLGCDEAQGYYLSRPIPGAELLVLMLARAEEQRHSRASATASSAIRSSS